MNVQVKLPPLVRDFGSDDVIRDLIARVIWQYNDRHLSCGDYDAVSDRTRNAASLFKAMSLEEAELIRRALFG